MRYIEVTIHTKPNQIDPLTCVLMDMGIAGFVVFDPGDVEEFLDKKNTYDWDYVSEEVLRQREAESGVTFYLDDDEAGRSLLAELTNLMNTSGVGIACDMSFRVADDVEWKDNWKEFFKPAKITDRIVVKPTWESYDRKEGELVLQLDPGMAFGTGTHPTTSLCIRLLEKYIQSPEDVVLDVGCGSGILSIAAALLGVERTVGVEIDPVAVAVAKENVALNGMESQIEVREGDLTKGLDIRADIVAANLMADLVMMLSADVAKHLRGRGVYISSGILLEKQEQVAAAIRSSGFEILEIVEEGEWCAIAASLRKKV